MRCLNSTVSDSAARGVKTPDEPNSPAVQKAMGRFYRKRVELLLCDYRHALTDTPMNVEKAQQAYEALMALVEGIGGVNACDKVQMPDKARAGIEVLHQVVESLLTTSRYVDEEGEATMALADLSACIADPPFRLNGADGVSVAPVSASAGAFVIRATGPAVFDPPGRK